MRIKTDFVTNSSSTAYVMGFKQEEFIDFQNFLNYMRGAVSKPKKIETLEEGYRHVYDQYKEEFEYEFENGKMIFYVDVSDELGHGFFENTKFMSNIISTSGW